MAIEHVLAVVPVADLKRSRLWYETHAYIKGLRRRGLEPGEIVEANKGVRLSALTDPDGNTVTLIGGFRVRY